MSAIGDVLRAVKDVLLLQSQVERMEAEIRLQNERFAKFVDTVTDINNRLIRIETMIEMSARAAPQPRIEDQ